MGFKKKKRRFGTVALNKGFINVDQLIEALAVQVKENVEKKRNRPLGEILEGLGYMKDREIKEILESRFEQRFGDIAVSKGFIKLDHLIQAMTKQVKEETKKGEHRLVGEILIELGYITMSETRVVLDAIGR
jgi:hypothetical protein